MSWLTDDELADLRADMGELLPDTVIVKRVTSNISDAGYEIGTAIAVGTVAGRIDIFNKQTVGQYAMLDAARTYYQLTVGHDASVNDGDTLTISGADYDVIQAHANQSSRGVRRALIVRL